MGVLPRSLPMFPAKKAERARIREALVASVGERGFSDTELGDVLRRAHTDKAGFEHHYPSLDACFAEAWEAFTQEYVDRAQAAYLAQETWRDGIRALAWELFCFLSEDHLRARICFVDVNFGGELVQATRDRYMDSFIELIHLGRHEVKGGGDIPREQAEAVVGAIWEQIAAPIQAGKFDELIDVVPSTLYLLFVPYLGPEAAEEELRRGREESACIRGGQKTAGRQGAV
jgi:AcrR family transcriptional regulator